MNKFPHTLGQTNKLNDSDDCMNTQPAVNALTGISSPARTTIIFVENDSDTGLERLFLTCYPPPLLGVSPAYRQKEGNRIFLPTDRKKATESFPIVIDALGEPSSMQIEQSFASQNSGHKSWVSRRSGKAEHWKQIGNQLVSDAASQKQRMDLNRNF